MFSLELLMASGQEVSLSLRLWFLAKSKPEELWILLSQVFEDFAYDACQHCPHLWIQDRILGNLNLWLLS